MAPITEPRRMQVPPSAPLPSTLAYLTDDTFLEVLIREGPASRARIAKVTGISKPTISESAQRLLTAGLIAEVGQTTTGARGRSAVLYDVNADYGHIVGVALERGHVVVRTLDYRGALVCERQTDTTGGDLEDAVAEARNLVDEGSSVADTPRLAVAVSVAAPVDPRAYTVRPLADSPFTGTVPDFAAALGLAPDEPLVVDNDVNWATIAESRVGSMQEAENFLFVYFGSGIGAGLFLSGGLHRGAGGSAGEIAFLRMSNGETLMRRLGRSPIGTPDGRSIDLARAREFLGVDTGLDEIVDDTVRVISNVATAIDPGRIVLGGPLSEIEPFADRLRIGIERAALTSLEVGVSSLGRDAPVEGAAIGALELASRSREARRQ